jgi:hypothetical protein
LTTRAVALYRTSAQELYELKKRAQGQTA